MTVIEMVPGRHDYAVNAGDGIQGKILRRLVFKCSGSQDSMLMPFG